MCELISLISGDANVLEYISQQENSLLRFHCDITYHVLLCDVCDIINNQSWHCESGWLDMVLLDASNWAICVCVPVCALCYWVAMGLLWRLFRSFVFRWLKWTGIFGVCHFESIFVFVVRGDWKFLFVCGEDRQCDFLYFSFILVNRMGMCTSGPDYRIIMKWHNWEELPRYGTEGR